MNTELDKKINQYLDENKEQFVEDLKKLVSFNSVKSEAKDGKPFGVETAKTLDCMMGICDEAGLKTTNYDYYCMDAEYGEGDEVVASLAHLDIVPAGDGWTYEPFSPVVEGNLIYARGVCDNKGPGLAALYGLKALINAGVKLNRKIKLIYGCDEETGMTDMKYYLTKVKAPDYAFSPDAMFPLIFAEKHGINGTYTCSIKGKTALTKMNAGIAVNSVPSVATAEITADTCPESTDKVSYELSGTTLLITAQGVAAHASVPQDGDNAIINLTKVLLEILPDGDAAIPYLENVIKYLTDYNGKGLGIFVSDEPSGLLTCNMGIISFADGILNIKIDIRHPVTADCEVTMDKLKTALPLFDLSEISMHHGVYRPKDSFLVKTLLEVYRDLTGDETEPLSMGGGTYARTLPNAVAYGAKFAGSVSGGSHGVDEHCDLDELMKAARIYAHSFYKLANG